MQVPSGNRSGRKHRSNPYDGHTLGEQLEQSSILLQDLPGAPRPKTVLVDLGFRGVDADISSVHLIHRGKHKTPTRTKRRWLKRRQEIEPIIGHVKHDQGMRRCWLKGETGDGLHAVLCAAGYNLRWLLRAIVHLGLSAIFYLRIAALARQCRAASISPASRPLSTGQLRLADRLRRQLRSCRELNFAGLALYSVLLRSFH